MRIKMEYTNDQLTINETKRKENCEKILVIYLFIFLKDSNLSFILTPFPSIRHLINNENVILH